MQQLSVFPGYMYENTTAEGLLISPVEFAACVLTPTPVLVFLLMIQRKFIATIHESGMR